MNKTSVNIDEELESYQTTYGTNFISVLKYLMVTKELRFDSHLDGTYFVRGVSTETGLQVERNFELRESNAFSEMVNNGLLTPVRSANNGNTFEMNAEVKSKAKKFLK